MATPAPDAVKRLVDRFDQDRKVFLSGDHLAGTWDWGLGTRDPNPSPKPLAPNPSVAALGWDMDNKQGLSETFKQVILEETIRVAGASKAPDYTLASFPAVNIHLKRPTA